LLENNAQEQLIFKHAISTVVSGRVGPHAEGKIESRPQSASAGHPASSATAPEAAAVAGD
jgi:host factor-I protein